MEVAVDDADPDVDVVTLDPPVPTSEPEPKVPSVVLKFVGDVDQQSKDEVVADENKTTKRLPEPSIIQTRSATQVGYI